MKIRTDFVSNSSSSSFIIICNEKKLEINLNKLSKYIKKNCLTLDKKFKLPTIKDGEYKFGWDFKKYNNFFDKVNWAAITLKNMNFCALKSFEIKQYEKYVDIYKKSMKMFEDFFKKYLDVDIEVDLDFNKFENGYIDHQSTVPDNDENSIMFESDQFLYNFLVNLDSFIITGNDNEDEFENLSQIDF